MHAINAVKAGTVIIPEISDGIFHAAVAVIPANKTATVKTTADQNPNDDVFGGTFTVDLFFVISSLYRVASPNDMEDEGVTQTKSHFVCHPTLSTDAERQEFYVIVSPDSLMKL
jgi:hypothetical protein